MPARFFQKGFTLIELLLVIGIIAVLVGITIAALAPTKQWARHATPNVRQM